MCDISLEQKKEKALKTMNDYKLFMEKISIIYNEDLYKDDDFTFVNILITILKNIKCESGVFTKIDEIHHAIEKLKEYPYKEEYKYEHYYTTKFLIFSMKRLKYLYQLFISRHKNQYVTNENDIKNIEYKIKAIEQFLKREYGTKIMMIIWNKNDDDDDNEYINQLDIIGIKETPSWDNI